ncbi:MAG: VF530 family protein [Campylobacterota bacterium]|nr:VF530 family protein [Campylobacterota bacterium]
MHPQPNNPFHGITLEKMVTDLYEHYGWEQLGKLIKIRCFNSDPSVKSSLKFIRKEYWARLKVEKLYLKTFKETQEK